MSSQRIYLQTLGDSQYELASDRPDIRDWEVKDAQGRRVGYVDELLVDEKASRMRYLILYLNSDHLHLKGRKVLLPIGIAELHAEDDDVLLPSVSGEQLRALPAYHRDLRIDEEQTICSILDCATKASMKTQDTLYRQACFDEERLFRTRRRAAEEAYRIGDRRGSERPDERRASHGREERE